MANLTKAGKKKLKAAIRMMAKARRIKKAAMKMKKKSKKRGRR